eukprot:IDg6635t1
MHATELRSSTATACSLSYMNTTRYSAISCTLTGLLRLTNSSSRSPPQFLTAPSRAYPSGYCTNCARLLEYSVLQTRPRVLLPPTPFKSNRQTLGSSAPEHALPSYGSAPQPTPKTSEAWSYYPTESISQVWLLAFENHRGGTAALGGCSGCKSISPLSQFKHKLYALLMNRNLVLINYAIAYKRFSYSQEVLENERLFGLRTSLTKECTEIYDDSS